VLQYPVTATGPASEHVVAFDRGGVVAVATRLPLRLEGSGGWGETALDLVGDTWTDVLTRRPVTDPRLASLTSSYPVALLVAADA
jgi:(1->4)-alpha-D-glucan 1-alpha-D-glucosylmutase